MMRSGTNFDMQRKHIRGRKEVVLPCSRPGHCVSLHWRQAAQLAHLPFGTYSSDKTAASVHWTSALSSEMRSSSSRYPRLMNQALIPVRSYVHRATLQLSFATSRYFHIFASRG